MGYCARDDRYEKSRVNTFSIQEIEQWVDAKLPQYIQDLADICRIPSIAVVGEKKQPPFGEACVRVLDEMLLLGKRYGFDTENYESYVGRISYGKGSSEIGIWSHLDVVETGENWTYPPYELTVSDGYLIARGSNDNKSSAILALYVLRFLKEHGVRTNHRIHAYFGTCEEQGMYDLDAFVKKYPCPQLSLVPDSGFPVCKGERGSFNGELTATLPDSSALLELYCDCGAYMVPDRAEAVVICQKEKIPQTAPDYIRITEQDGKLRIVSTGKSTYAVNPSKGVNALTQLLEYLCGSGFLDEADQALLNLPIALNREKNAASLGIDCEDEPSGPIILTVTTAALKEKKLSFGFVSKYPVTCGEMNFAQIAKSYAEKAGFELNVTRSQKPNYFDPNHPAAKIMTSVYQEISHDPAEPFVMSGGTYARKLPNAFACGTGMPLPPPGEGLFAPGHGDYHQPDEAISIERIRKAMIIYISGILKIDQECDTLDNITGG